MKQVWIYDENKIFITYSFVEEVIDNMTIVPLLVGYYKPTFNEDLQEWFEGATEEEIKQWEEENKPLQEPTELELIKQELETLKLQQASFDESQKVQDMLIDDLVFEVIPSIEQQVQQGVEGVTLNNMISRGSEGMAGYLARKIIEGRDYRTVFKTNAYKQYQDEVDTILELEGHAHLIKRDELGVL